MRVGNEKGKSILQSRFCDAFYVTQQNLGKVKDGESKGDIIYKINHLQPVD